MCVQVPEDSEKVAQVLRVAKNMQVLVSPPKTSCKTEINTLKTSRDPPSHIFLSASCPSLVRVHPWRSGVVLQCVTGAMLSCAMLTVQSYKGVVFASTTGNRRGNSQRGSETSVKVREKHLVLHALLVPKVKSPEAGGNFSPILKGLSAVGWAQFTGAPQNCGKS